MRIKRPKYHSYIRLEDVLRADTQKIEKECETLVYYRVRTRQKRKITLAWYILGLWNGILANDLNLREQTYERRLGYELEKMRLELEIGRAHV